MKYLVKVRKTVVHETTIEVNVDGGVIKAMGLAEAIVDIDPTVSKSTTEGKWVAVSVKDKSE